MPTPNIVFVHLATSKKVHLKDYKLGTLRYPENIDSTTFSAMSPTDPANVFDIIFAGGGAAACITAGRLAAADPSLKILIVEAGPHTQEDLAHVQPARFLSHMVPGSKTMKFLISQPSAKLGDGVNPRFTIVPAGQCLGGGSSVNFVMYNRGVPSEYDDWETKFQNPGWGSKDFVPLMNKSETYQADPSSKTRGRSGPLGVSFGGCFNKLPQDFLQMVQKYDKDRGISLDSSDPDHVNTYGRWAKWINQKDGRRSDVAHAFIYPQTENRNLRVLTGHFVNRVIIENGRATGIEYTPSPQLHPDAPSEPVIALASKWVVVSGGSFGSPLILERSGIGAAAILQKYGIKQVVDLPGVGERYQDHQIIAPVYRATEDSGTFDKIFKGDAEEIQKWTPQWLKDGSGMLGSNGIDAGIKYRPTEAQVKTIGPAFQTRWKEFYADHPDRSVMTMGCVSFCFGALDTAPSGSYYTIGVVFAQPSSLGHIHITSATDPGAHPDFHAGFLDNEDDLEGLVWTYKISRELARRMENYRGEYAPTHPVFPEGSAAAVTEDPTPVPIDTPDIHYTAEDDEAIRTYVRKIVMTSWHALGTCAMMPREQGGVVDSKLNVYGVKGLKVADLSIAPQNVGGNTYSTTCGIGEKAALILAEELGISGV
ncbi:alcohol oxidase [Cristinia sonorae]|uniref:Alcohol oxidase n=1 Tax=Cristinia sonorae TaxID=1940300 RepID=A0A8K0XRV0_9AGAR|nr:alcohol oxidase [Cristinia sonorae]